MRIGILSVQGDIYENKTATKSALKEMDKHGEVVQAKTAEEIKKVDALIIPGGESTTIGRLCQENGSFDVIKQRIDSGMPVLGICAGLVLLSSTVSDRVTGKTEQPLLGALDVSLERNSFGRQIRSFEADISLGAIGIPRFNGVFIRAPSISKAGDVEVLAKLGEKIVAVKKDKIMATAFHPELAGDLSVHKHFIESI
ncbi:MAG: pyridoxal 5'-phosphate synthase glutaminase subunit PdxT [Nitrosopumilus sp. H8]|nr:MAG: pyridoxal 5'-phosphate synthase glutaminase subunit PdxT [Nitrosopumilus sp. H8]